MYPTTTTITLKGELSLYNTNTIFSRTADSLWPVGADDRSPIRSSTFKPTNHTTTQCADARVENRAKSGGLGSHQSPVGTQRAGGEEEERRKLIQASSPAQPKFHNHG